MTYRDFYIDKKNKGKRLISAPDEELLKYQKNKLKPLNKLFFKLEDEYSVYNIINGFVKKRNAVSAAIQHIGYKYTIMSDISDFFNSVKKENILLLPDRYKADKNLFHEKGYLPQGFATSPILANIFLIPIIQQISDHLQDFYEDTVITIYADDIQISFNNEFYKETILKDIENILNNFDIKLNKSKTRIRYAKYGFRKILGINVGEEEVRPTRKIIRKIRAARHQTEYNNLAKSSLGGLVTWSKCSLPNK